MKEWIKRFWNDHGDRIFFGAVATCFALGFVWLGARYELLKELLGSGITILIGVAMLAYNKARGTNGKEPPK